MAHPQTSFVHTTFAPDSFCARKRDVVWKNTLLYQLNVLKETGRYDAFDLKKHVSYDDEGDVWPVPNHLFWDSDVAKWIEGACYFLHDHKSKEIEGAVSNLVEKIRKAQRPDGYLNIHFTVVAPQDRFSNLRDLHELYNAGHLIEAALAHHQLYGNDLLLAPLSKYVDLFCETFGPRDGQKHGYPGHPEVELALLRLYSVTEDQKHLELARYFVDERGNPIGQDGRHYYDVEAEARGERNHERPSYYPDRRAYWYQQAHKPILEQEEVMGHSVRAMYLLTAAADLTKCDLGPNTSGNDYRAALSRLWNNMVEKKMYVTGGIGAIKQWEGFGIDYFLPQSTDEGGCYAETCASIGVMMLAERLLQLDLQGSIGDVMELEFYNAVLTGMSCDGKQFTYVNQLASSDTDPAKRSEWFTCACCPPNVTRLLGYLGGYMWTQNAPTPQMTEINVHMFGSATLVADEISLTQTSDYPWDGEIQFSLTAPETVEVNISIRIPAWAHGWKLSPRTDTTVSRGYLKLPNAYLQANPKFTLYLPLEPRFISPHPFTNQDTVALARGPLVYCLEDVDNSWVTCKADLRHFRTLVLDPASTIVTEKTLTDKSTGEKYVALMAKGGISFLDVACNPGPSLPSEAITTEAGDGVTHGVRQLVFVPYYFRANRGGEGQMRVGLRRAKTLKG